MQHQERKPEHPEGMFGAQLVALDVDVEMLGEPVDRERRELPARRVDVGQVVTGLVVIASAEVSVTSPPSGPVAGRGSNVAVKLACGSGNPTLT